MGKKRLDLCRGKRRHNPCPLRRPARRKPDAAPLNNDSGIPHNIKYNNTRPPPNISQAAPDISAAGNAINAPNANPPNRRNPDPVRPTANNRGLRIATTPRRRAHANLYANADAVPNTYAHPNPYARAYTYAHSYAHADTAPNSYANACAAGFLSR